MLLGTEVAALFVESGGAYYGVPGVDPWDEARDARGYPGVAPVVAHPPCSTWSQLAPINEARYGHPVGADGGCFLAAVRADRAYGGVLEHPAGTKAWPAFHIQKPTRIGQWDLIGEVGSRRAWTTAVFQGAYGHRAPKKTWLYAVTVRRPPLLNWARPKARACVSNLNYYDHGLRFLPRLRGSAASATPIAFRDLLISIARDYTR